MKDSIEHAAEPASPSLAKRIETPKPLVISPMSRDDKAVLKDLSLSAIVVMGPDGRVPAYLGDETGQLPFIVGMNSNWEDAVVAPYERASPYRRQQLHGRIWFASEKEARRFRTELRRHLATVATSLRGEWHALNDGVSVAELIAGISGFAEKLGIQTMMDADVVELVRGLAAEGSDR